MALRFVRNSSRSERSFISLVSDIRISRRGKRDESRASLSQTFHWLVIYSATLHFNHVVLPDVLLHIYLHLALEPLLRAWTKPGDLVLDVFAGEETSTCYPKGQI